MKRMNRLYEKSPLSFALVWIGVYCALQSLANPLSAMAGIECSAHALLNIALTAALLYWIRQNGLLTQYGLCKPALPARRFLWYKPQLFLATKKQWNGVKVNHPPAGTVCYLVHMLCVGFLEEVIFRGLLFLALAKEGAKKAAIISSITFGLGHLLHQVDGSGMELAANLWQVCGAMGIGLLFVVIFYRGGSLLPCILTHAAINALSTFANEAGLSVEKRILWSGTRLLIAVLYTLLLTRTLPEGPSAAQDRTAGQ